MSKKRTIREVIPFLLSGNIWSSQEDFLDSIRSINELNATKRIDDVEKRYESLTNHPVTGYIGLQLFSEIIKYLKDASLIIPPPAHGVDELILRAQKRVLHYHSIQYETVKHDG